jgi:peroxiredoxin family protein
MSARLVVFLHSKGWSHAYQATALALTARAMGREVVLALAFDALEAHARSALGEPCSEEDRAARARAEELGVSGPLAMLGEARSLGVKVVTCETVARLSGVKEAAVRACVDEVVGLASLLRAMEDAQVLYL